MSSERRPSRPRLICSIDNFHRHKIILLFNCFRKSPSKIALQQIPQSPETEILGVKIIVLSQNGHIHSTAVKNPVKFQSHWSPRHPYLGAPEMTIFWLPLIDTKGEMLLDRLVHHYSYRYDQCAIEVRSWVTNHTPHKILDLINYPYHNISSTILVKRVPCDLVYNGNT